MLSPSKRSKPTPQSDPFRRRWQQEQSTTQPATHIGHPAVCVQPSAAPQQAVMEDNLQTTAAGPSSDEDEEYYYTRRPNLRRSLGPNWIGHIVRLNGRPWPPPESNRPLGTNQLIRPVLMGTRFIAQQSAPFIP